MKFSFSLKEQIIVVIAAVILILAIFVIFVFKPQWDKLSAYNSDFNSQKQEIAQSESQLKNLEIIKSQAPAVEAKSIKLSKAMPMEADLPSFIVEIQQLAQESNVNVGDIEPSAAAPSSTFSLIPVKLTVSGSYFNIINFIYELAKMPRKIKVNKLDYSISDQGYPLLQVNIDSDIFIYGVAAASATGTGTTGTTTGTTGATPAPAQSSSTTTPSSSPSTSSSSPATPAPTPNNSQTTTTTTPR